MTERRVLLVDDEDSLRLTLAANLELEGFVVTEASSGAPALELAKRQSFDLVLTDIRMPGMNGVELYHQLRELHPRLPVVLMTGFALEELVTEALESGAYTVLSKPFNVEHAISVLKQAVRAPAVLVVDDQDRVAAMAAEGLEGFGLRARSARGMSEALSELKAGDVDLCVIDMLLGEGATGPELLERLREQRPGLSVIAMSGQNTPSLVRQMATMGMHSFLKKPFAIRELVRSIAVARRTATAL
jgi:DNA-binding NtrC family response regulator